MDRESQSSQDGKALSVIKWITDIGISGRPGFKGAGELADEYLRDSRYANDDARIDALIRAQAAWNAGTGFLTGVGGIATLPVAIPSALLSSWVIQTRLAATIAIIRGYDPYSEEVHTAVLLCLIGNNASEAVARAGVAIGTKVAQNAVARVPGKALIAINKQVGFRLLTKFGQTGAINLVKIVPVVGGVVMGTVDGVSCLTVGRAAKRFFVGRGSDEDPIVVGFAEMVDEADFAPSRDDPIVQDTLCEEGFHKGKPALFCTRCNKQREGVFCSECGATLVLGAL